MSIVSRSANACQKGLAHSIKFDAARCASCGPPRSESVKQRHMSGAPNTPGAPLVCALAQAPDSSLAVRPLVIGSQPSPQREVRDLLADPQPGIFVEAIVNARIEA